MIFSAQQIFSDDQAITATAISTNVIDLGAPGTPYGGAAALNQDIGKGVPVNILIQVTVAFATLTSLAITVEQSAAAALTTPTVLATESLGVAALVVGTQLHVQVVPVAHVTRRYMGIRYTVGGSDATAGKITAGITWGNQTNLTG